jgi:hypothetical protein
MCAKYITTHASALSPTCAASIAKHHIPPVCHLHVTFSCCPQLRTKLTRCSDFQISLKQSMGGATGKWKSWWNTCIQAEGAYFKED